MSSAGGSVAQFAVQLGSGAGADVTVLGDRVGGGSAYADMVLESDGGAYFAKKHLGPPRYDSFVLPLGLVMSTALFDWIAESWGPQPETRDGAVLSLDPQLAVKLEAGFAGSLIAETTVPALDAASTDTGHVVLRVQPEAVETTSGSGKVSFAGTKQRLWRTASFRLQVEGLDCSKVARIESFTVRRDIEVATSGGRGTHLTAGQVAFPNLKVSIAQVSAQSWRDWHESFVVDGNNGESFERTGALSFLSADLKAELTRIELSHLGIVRLAPAADQPGRLTAELYCEEMALVQPEPGGGA